MSYVIVNKSLSSAGLKLGGAKSKKPCINVIQGFLF